VQRDPFFTGAGEDLCAVMGRSPWLARFSSLREFFGNANLVVAGRFRPTSAEDFLTSSPRAVAPAPVNPARRPAPKFSS
jgi:hypothetical protein